MRSVRFGNTGLQVSNLCLGTMIFGSQCDRAQSFAIMDAASEGGINFLDAADIYPAGSSGSAIGLTESIIGEWLKGKRHQFIVATKCAGRTGPHGWDRGMSRKHILDAVDDSLRRLGTDYVDLYQLHGYDLHTTIDEALGALAVTSPACADRLRRPYANGSTDRPLRSAVTWTRPCVASPYMRDTR